MSGSKTYGQKRSFEGTPEPAASFDGNVDPGKAKPGKSFVIQQHWATRLHHDLRLEMFNGDTAVLASWAVPHELPLKKGSPHLAVHVEDHPMDYATFSGEIPAGNYGAGQVRIFDSGTYEVVEQGPGKLTFTLHGQRLKGTWHLFRTRQSEDDKDEWLVTFGEDLRPAPDPLPSMEPMLATLVRDPFDKEDWIFEPKWDGVRTLATCTQEETFLLSRRGNNVTATYPEIAALHNRVVATDAILDGEIVAMDNGRPSFEKLQSRINLQNPRDIEKARKQCPVVFIAFDVIYIDGRSLLKVPLEERKSILDELIVPSPIVQVSPCIEGEGTALFEAAKAKRLEGIVAKKLGSPYRPGRRNKEWLKIKAIEEADLVIGGWSPGEGSRSTTFGSLLVGAYDEDGLRFVGAVGSGFDDKMLARLMPMLEERLIDGCPFTQDPREVKPTTFGKPIRNPKWIEPELVARVEYRELTSVGRLRAPSFKGLSDALPEDCLFEQMLVPGSD
jgi:bifunctional non-homologous end joining protein LigD